MSLCPHQPQSIEGSLVTSWHPYHLPPRPPNKTITNAAMTSILEKFPYFATMGLPSFLPPSTGQYRKEPLLPGGREPRLPGRGKEKLKARWWVCVGEGEGADPSRLILWARRRHSTDRRSLHCLWQFTPQAGEADGQPTQIHWSDHPSSHSAGLHFSPGPFAPKQLPHQNKSFLSKRFLLPTCQSVPSPKLPISGQLLHQNKNPGVRVLFVCFLAMRQDMRDLTSLIRDGTCAPFSGSRALTPGPPRKSQSKPS